jgi:hypothetical protein
MTMTVNLRLTHAVKDRVIQSIQLNASELLISFVDGSTMTVTIAECNSPPLHEGARIRQPSEDEAKILVECGRRQYAGRDDSRSGELCDRSGQEQSGRVSRLGCGLLALAENRPNGRNCCDQPD